MTRRSKYKMNYPIIELRQNNFFVLDKFHGKILRNKAILPYNNYRNLTKYVIDSSGDVWSFKHKKNNCVGVRKLITKFWNVSQDYYSVKLERNVNVGRFKELISTYIEHEDPDQAEMALDLMKSISDIPNETVLSSVVSKLNL
ncbi:hypothetical protein OLL83_002318 [Shewanella algae]|uniref:hypothetical protein n=1 Tax=Shewanella algae TaxID=38313 RepID=UPI002230FB81|nr:hypothetical protein [Shewanella algae]UZD56644.1 hypothetical protein OLL83_002318 [Shewanella algae]